MQKVHPGLSNEKLVPSNQEKPLLIPISLDFEAAINLVKNT